jgi:signal transduction histidine kinase
MVDSLREFFLLNRQIVLFVYGLTFFVMGLAIFLQSRRHSRLRLARDLHWLAAFGLLHGIHEWGAIFIPIQAAYLPLVIIHLLQTIQIVLLALSFLCLLMFGAVTLEPRYPGLKKLVLLFGVIWGISFWLALYILPTPDNWHHLSDIWGRYLLGLPGSLLAAYGLRYQAQMDVAPLGISHIYRTLGVAGAALVAYAFFGGMVVFPADFFPANVLNYLLFEHTIGIPVQVMRSTVGLILSIAIIRALEVFEIELERLIEQLEVERIQAAERERIGQEIHDGAIQGVYSASLMLESIEPLLQEGSEATRRLQQAKSVLNAVNLDLRSYMISLRTESPPEPLIPSLQALIANPRFRGMLDIELTYDREPSLKPMQVYQVIAIVQGCLSNTLRHARARQVKLGLQHKDGVMSLTVEDDGRGFVPESVPAGYGLRSMRDRARLLGGQLTIDSTAGKGTRVVFALAEEKNDG